MRLGEWVALEHRDIDRDARFAFVQRSFSKGRRGLVTAGRGRPRGGRARTAAQRPPAAGPLARAERAPFKT
jgi:hypothetical protein